MLTDLNSNKPLNILKAALPFMPVSAQKAISYYVKIEEFNLICNSLDETIDNSITACDYEEGPEKPNAADLIDAIKPYISKDEQKLIDMFYNTIHAMNIYEMYRSLTPEKTDETFTNLSEHYEDNEFEDLEQKNNSNSNNGINIEALKKLLTPEQQLMFNTYASMLGGSNG